MASLTIRQLDKSYPLAKGARNLVLNKIDLTLHSNEFVSIVGASGCGKSTLLSIAAGLEEFDSGEVLVDDQPIQGPGIDRGVVFQSYTLLPWLTARQNIEFALKSAGYAHTERAEIAQQHLELVKLAHAADKWPAELSGGMQQRVAIARALSYRPKILLMDEPFGALDAMTRRQMQQLLLEIWETHRLTVMFVTHDIEEAIYLSDRVVVMKPAEIDQCIDIPIERPRDFSVTHHPDFLNIQSQIFERISQPLEHA
ncbi:ABC transporter ATP-binding protein [Celerinatantimonas sp. YJH-8]|uniref:ABC transporter ATP-binding protein n=1 Tax=Celerinatantimonas sp. YJH-8 TaxID=3228714 RepID=UPI0038BE35D9